MTGLPADQEVRRLWLGRFDDAIPPEYDAFEVQAVAGVGAEMVLARVREVLTIVLLHDPVAWPDAGDWRGILPAWFVALSAAEENAADATARLNRTRALSPEARAEQERQEESAPWSVSAFLHWFRPENRQWWWWASDTSVPDMLRIRLIVEDSPVADEALDWLLRAAGADDVANENLLRARRRAAARS